MNENNRKRTSSFKKMFPIFFSHKSKSKDATKFKDTAGNSSNSNTYQNPHAINTGKRTDNQDNNDRIYEDLTVSQTQQSTDNESQCNDEPSNHSSSSTLVSDSAKNRTHLYYSSDGGKVEKKYSHHVARPQVPPKPINEAHTTATSRSMNDNHQYPDVYYHSLEKLAEKISPLDEIEIYRASKAQADPAPVGAEIKRVSTKFLISPKKEAEVRTIQPTRARSLSLDKHNAKREAQIEKYNTRESNVKKPYNYSAPTSPMPINHRIPSMPKTVSPYEQVRKTITEAEEKRNSLNRVSVRNKLSHSPRPIDLHEMLKTPTPSTTTEGSKLEEVAEKEKTRQKVEAFYWQKLKEQKQKEDEYLMRQSLQYSSMRNPVRSNVYSNSTCSSPNSMSVEAKSASLPRGRDLQSYCSNQPIYALSPFVRAAPERRTDSFIKTRTSPIEQEIIYRHPEKLNFRTTSPVISQDRKQTPIFQRGSLTQVSRGSNTQPKRVSFEEQCLSKESDFVRNYGDSKVTKLTNESSSSASLGLKGPRGPPRPPVRTTSVGINQGNASRKNLFPGQSVYSESESGSEAGEIQRILQGDSQKGK